MLTRELQNGIREMRDLMFADRMAGVDPSLLDETDEGWEEGDSLLLQETDQTMFGAVFRSRYILAGVGVKVRLLLK